MTDPSRWIEDARARLVREREELAERLRELGISPARDEEAPRGQRTAGADEGDRAQASERQDVSFARRERVAERINRLTIALQRIDDGSYGICEICGADIPRARLDALPETTTCLDCQQRLEAGEAASAA